MSDTETPYRKPAPPCVVAERHGPTRLERFFAWLLPAFLFSSCRWYRSASGGRWSQTYCFEGSGLRYTGWRRMPFCVISDGVRLNVTGCTSTKCLCENYDP